MAKAEKLQISKPEMRLGKGRRTDYGKVWKGTVVAEDRVTPVTYRESTRSNRAKGIAILTTGWWGKTGSMSVPAHVAAEEDYASVAFNFTNTGGKDAIAKNVQNLVDVIEASPEELKRILFGLSMGGLVGAKAIAETDSPVDTAHFIASAGFLPRDPAVHQAVVHFAHTGREIADFSFHHPVQALRLGASTLMHAVERPLAIRAEIAEMTHANGASEAIRSVAQRENPTYLSVHPGLGDRLIPYWAQRAGTEDLPIDAFTPYDGGHITFIHNPALMRGMLQAYEQRTGIGTIAEAA